MEYSFGVSSLGGGELLQVAGGGRIPEAKDLELLFAFQKSSVGPAGRSFPAAACGGQRNAPGEDGRLSGDWDGTEKSISGKEVTLCPFVSSVLAFHGVNDAVASYLPLQ